MVTREDKVSRTPSNAMQQKTILSGLAVAGGKENKGSNRNLLGSYSTPTVCVCGATFKVKIGLADPSVTRMTKHGLGTLVAHLEDPDLTPSIHMAAHKHL